MPPPIATPRQAGLPATDLQGTRARLLFLCLRQGTHLGVRQQRLDAGYLLQFVGRNGDHLRAKTKHPANIDLDGANFIVGTFHDLDYLPKIFLLSEL